MTAEPLPASYISFYFCAHNQAYYWLFISLLVCFRILIKARKYFMNCQVVLKPLGPSMRNIYCFRKWGEREAGTVVIHLFHLENRAKAFQILASQSSVSWAAEVGLISKAVMARWYKALIWSKAPGFVQLCIENVNDDNRIYAWLMSCNKIPQASATVLFCSFPSPDAVGGHCTWLRGPL